MFKKIIVTLVAIFTIALPVFASAQGLKDASGMLDKIGGANGEKIGVSGNLADSVATVIKTILALVGTIFLVLTIYAGVLWMTAQGEESRVEKAKEILKAAVIGLVIIMSAYAITYFVTSKLSEVSGASSNNSQQSQANCPSFSDQSSCIAPRDTTGNQACAWEVSAQTMQGACVPYVQW